MIQQQRRANIFPQKPTLVLKLCFFSSWIALIPLFFVQTDIYVDHIEYTIYQKQLWRPFFAFYGRLNPYLGILGIMIQFWWLRNRLSDAEQRFSTVYTLVDIFLQNILAHSIFLVTGLLLIFMFGDFIENWLYAFGWWYIVLLIIWREASYDPEGYRRYCCLPFLIKKKHYATFLTCLSFFFGFIAAWMQIIVCILGYYQAMVKRSNIIKLPFAFYEKVQACLPNFIKSRQDFISVHTVKAQLLTQCCGYRGQEEEETEDPNKYRSQELSEKIEQEKKEEREEEEKEEEKGVQIGSSTHADFTSHWKGRSSDTEE